MTKMLKNSVLLQSVSTLLSPIVGLQYNGSFTVYAKQMENFELHRRSFFNGNLCQFFFKCMSGGIACSLTDIL